MDCSVLGYLPVKSEILVVFGSNAIRKLLYTYLCYAENVPISATGKDDTSVNVLDPSS